MAILQIKDKATDEWMPIADPQTLTWDIYDLDSESGGRNQLGEMFRDRVAIKRKLNCTWGPMEPAEMAVLLRAMKEVFFELSFPDAYGNEEVSLEEDDFRRTGTFYVGDRSTPMYMWNEDKKKYLWSGLSANFIER